MTSVLRRPSSNALNKPPRSGHHSGYEQLSLHPSPEACFMATAPHPLVLRGREALQRGDLRAVEAAAEERLKTAGRDVNALELRSIVQQQRGQFGEAARTLQTVIGIDSQVDWAHNALIELLVSHGKLAD